jgi:hypothetical protein
MCESRALHPHGGCACVADPARCSNGSGLNGRLGRALGCRAMTVEFPEMRSRLRQAVDALCDVDLQERLWVRGERKTRSEPGFDDTLLFLVDELEMYEVTELVGAVLMDVAELTAFTALTLAVEAVIDATGKLGSFQDAEASGVPWTTCVEMARALQLLLSRVRGPET